MHAGTDDLITPIHQQLADLRQITVVLTSSSFPDYISHYKQFQKVFLAHGYDKDSPKWNLLLESFQFIQESNDTRTALLRQAFTGHPSAQLKDPSSLKFYDLLFFTFQNIHRQKNLRFPQCNAVLRLINEQIRLLELRLVHTIPVPAESSRIAQLNTEIPSQPRPILQPHFLTRNRIMAGIGATLMSTSLLLQLSPSFSLWIGVSLSPAMFVVFFILGAGLLGYGLSRKEPRSGPASNSNSRESYLLYGQHIESVLKFCFQFGGSGHRSEPPPATTTASFTPSPNQLGL